MQATFDESSRVILDWYRVTSVYWGPEARRLVESQPWNNVSVYKEIFGDSREGLRLDAVMQISYTDYHHAGVYECRAHQIAHNERSRVFDSFSLEFDGK